MKNETTITISNLSTMEALEVQKVLRGAVGRKGIRIEVEEPEPEEIELFPKQYERLNYVFQRLNSMEAFDSYWGEEAYKVKDVLADVKRLRKVLLELTSETQKFETALSDLENSAHVANGLVTQETGKLSPSSR